MIRRPREASLHKKRSLAVGGRATSVAIEDAFWDSLKEIATHEGIPLNQLITQIDEKRRYANLSSAIRLFVLDHYMALANQKIAK